MNSWAALVFSVALVATAGCMESTPPPAAGTPLVSTPKLPAQRTSVVDFNITLQASATPGGEGSVEGKDYEFYGALFASPKNVTAVIHWNATSPLDSNVRVSLVKRGQSGDVQLASAAGKSPLLLQVPDPDNLDARTHYALRVTPSTPGAIINQTFHAVVFVVQ